jgi:uncharacterized membrane protein
MEPNPGDDDALDDEWLVDEWLATEPADTGPPAFVATLRHPLGITAVVLGLVIVLAMVALRPTGTSQDQAAAGLSTLGIPTEFVSGTVAEVADHPCPFQQDEDCQTVQFTITSGSDADRTVVQVFTGGVAPTFRVGTDVVLAFRAPGGTVQAIDTAPCSFDPGQTCELATIALSGDVDNGTATFESPEGSSGLRLGDDVDVSFDESGELLAAFPSDLASQYRFSDFERSNVLLIVLVVFAVAVIALGRWRGVAALVALGATLVVVLAWLLPAILDGRNTVFVAIVGASAIAYLALYMSHGFNLMTTVALLGTISALAITTALSWVTVEAARFTGFATEESTLLVLFDGVDIGGLVLAGMVLGAAGALDDVTVTQASSVWQLKSISPAALKSDLFRGGMRIGQHHIGSTVNTLLLAYLGASLPLAILIALAQQPLGVVVNSEVVAIEVVRTLVGSIGLVAAVPITTWLAVRTVSAADHPPSLPQERRG